MAFPKTRDKVVADATNEPERVDLPEIFIFFEF
jgi:hypothetical protein